MGSQAEAVLLAAQKKKPKPEPFLCKNKAALGHARKFLAAAIKQEAAKGEVSKAKEKLIELVAPFHLEQCHKRGSYEVQVRLDVKLAAVRLSFEDRYYKIPLNKSAALKELVGRDYPAFFQTAFGVKVKKAIADDQKQLRRAINELVKALGRDRFLEIFEADVSIEPTTAFTEARPGLEPKLLEALTGAGVRQVVTVAEA